MTDCLFGTVRRGPSKEEARPGSYYCTDGSVFIVDFSGTVAGGEGRFEGATGTWVGTAESQPTARVTAEVSVDLD